MILVDANLLLYSQFVDFPQHAAARVAFIAASTRSVVIDSRIIRTPTAS